jgi:hypothetical protein
MGPGKTKCLAPSYERHAPEATIDVAVKHNPDGESQQARARLSALVHWRPTWVRPWIYMNFNALG